MISRWTKFEIPGCDRGLQEGCCHRAQRDTGHLQGTQGMPLCFKEALLHQHALQITEVPSNPYHSVIL